MICNVLKGAALICISNFPLFGCHPWIPPSTPKLIECILTSGGACKVTFSINNNILWFITRPLKAVNKWRLHAQKRCKRSSGVVRVRNEEKRFSIFCTYLGRPYADWWMWIVNVLWLHENKLVVKLAKIHEIKWAAAHCWALWFFGWSVGVVPVWCVWRKSSGNASFAVEFVWFSMRCSTLAPSNACKILWRRRAKEYYTVSSSFLPHRIFTISLRRSFVISIRIKIR